MLLTLLVLALEGAPPPDAGLPESLTPEAGLAHLFPGPFAELLTSPDRVIVAGLAERGDELLTEEADTQFVAGWKKVLSTPERAAVLALVGKGSSYEVMNHARCAPKRCLFVMLCGGFNPSLQVTLEKGQRSARLRVCFGCGELWVTRFDGKKQVADEQAALQDEDGWVGTFSPLLPRPRPKK